MNLTEYERIMREKSRDSTAFTRGKKDGLSGYYCTGRESNGSYLNGFEVGRLYRKEEKENVKL